MTEIKSKIHAYGHAHESSWPSEFGTGEKGLFYRDKETGEIREGYPPNPNPVYDTSAMVIFDSMPPAYHEGACRTVESRKEWELLDKQHGTVTFGNIKDAKPNVDAAIEEKKRKAEIRKANKTALDVYRANPREVRQKIAKRAEEQMQSLKHAGLENKLKEAGVKYDD